MTIPTEVIMRMATLGLSEEQAKAVADMLTVVESATAATFEATIEAGKEKGRERWRKWKAGQGANDSKRLQTTANDSQQLTRDRVTRVEDKSQTTEIEPQPKKNTPNDVAAFKAALSGVCDADRVEAIIKHRRTKRGQITGHAAKLFIRDAEACGLTVPQAVDTCISRNWITVNADWLKPNQRGSPPAKPRTTADVAADLLHSMETANADPAAEIERDYPLALGFPGRFDG